MNWLKLGIPIVLGLAAGALNYWVLSGQQKTGAFVVVKDAVKAGDRLEEDNLDKVVLPGEPGSLATTAVPYADRSILYGRPALRNLAKNDLILYRDVTPSSGDLVAGKDEEALPVSLDGLHVDPKLIQVGDQIGFLVANPPPADSAKPKAGEQPKPVEPEYVGPFRVLSVGSVVNRRPGDGAPTGGDMKTITIALKLQGNSIKDDAMRKFLAAKYSDAEGGRRRILEVVLHPRQADEAEAKK
jgi:hypothetical protein